MRCWQCGNVTRPMYFQAGTWTCVSTGPCEAEAEVSRFFAKALLPYRKRPVLTLIQGGLSHGLD